MASSLRTPSNPLPQIEAKKRDGYVGCENTFVPLCISRVLAVSPAHWYAEFDLGAYQQIGLKKQLGQPCTPSFSKYVSSPIWAFQPGALKLSNSKHKILNWGKLKLKAMYTDKVRPWEVNGIRVSVFPSFGLQRCKPILHVLGVLGQKKFTPQLATKGW